MDLQKFLYHAKRALRVLIVIITNLYCIPTYLIWMWVIFLPLRILDHPCYWYMESVMYKWLLSMVASWCFQAHLGIEEIGENVSSYIGQRCLLIVNHQSTADVPMLMAAFHVKEQVLSSIMWIMDRMFRFTNFGAVSVTHGDYFITQGKHAREDQMRKLRDHIINVYLRRNRDWIILFPEGGFLSKRLETSIKYARENNFPVLRHVTLPRVGAMHLILNMLHPTKLKQTLSDENSLLFEGSTDHIEPLKWVIDVTIGYPDIQNPLDLTAICSASRPPCTTYIHYRCYPVEDVPFESQDELRDWVYARWAEKEEILDQYYTTGEFPKLPSSSQNREQEVPIIQVDGRQKTVERTRAVNINNYWIGFLHLFFLSSSYLHFYLIRRLWSYV